VNGTRNGHDTDVLIAGAGPVGLALAIELRRRGVAARIIDRSDGPATESRALGTQARTIEHFRMMGIGEDRLAPSLRIPGIAIHDGGSLVATVPTRVSRPDVTYDGILVMTQADTERMLLDRLDDLGGAVERGATLTALSQDAGGVHATITGRLGTETIRARYLAGCDGARSTVRHHLRAEFAGFTYPQEFLLADCRVAGNLGHDLGNGWLHPDGLLFALPLPYEGLWRIIVNTDRQAPDDRTAPTIEEVATLVRKRTGDALEITDAVWISRFRINCRMVNEYRHGAIFLAGDAAHVHSPVGGQGMNTGIQDAVNLGWKLALATSDRAAASLLDTYGEERMPIARAVLAGTDRGTRAIMTANPALRWLRDRALATAASIPAVQGVIAEQISQLGLDYRKSPLSGPAGRGGFAARSPRPGDRAPQAAFTHAATGNPSTLFDQYGLGGFTLLLFPDPAGGEISLRDATTLGAWVRDRLGDDCCPIVILPNAPADGEFPAFAATDHDGSIRRLFGVQEEAAVLVRPDGYIAARTAPIAHTAIWGALGEVFAADLLPDLPVHQGAA
jgi:2-polyprenyl-6-methoxyphenol hydroxylase-like FAD-dependent oxidoreductase